MDPQINQIIQKSLLEGFIKGLLLSVQIMWPFFLPFILFALIKIAFVFYKNQQLKKAGMPEIDRMTGPEFETYLSLLFQKMGYKTQLVGSTINDFGADIIIEKDGVRTAVQAKCWHSIVKESAVQEVYTSMNTHRCTKAMVVTNNFFSWHAMQLAKRNNVELWNRTKLMQSILDSKKEQSKAPI